ncbi:2Fe-2S iron-sulfur cluster protein [Paenibacillus cellulosilyticus]|uniref:2Fe-2S iron-sulfur cluster protein n=1 Tax=Paenibacillus cellulosilyticus TaxID=375489 RepID=A0A2V2YW29_9BACL|nr:2Fe-2S iron-sulfur cluster-binding protein [Paenibacillus cellulosilyticus]PWW05561.1 2Fe-2S iron-sulfur cluster protein [Paenibacillus cellulosilyticus]QKS45403.1 2Fe-2S iron-sulfur cluster binding domain-containing protein [Paenibacillus cellulosilyticus]
MSTNNNVYEVTFQPSGKKAMIKRGTTVLDAARRTGLPIVTRCGGKASCMMCKVRHVGENRFGLSPTGDNELRKLGGLHEEGYRLGCQAKVIGSVELMLPEDPLRAAVRKLLEQQHDDDNTLW